MDSALRPHYRGTVEVPADGAPVNPWGQRVQFQIGHEGDTLVHRYLVISKITVSPDYQAAVLADMRTGDAATAAATSAEFVPYIGERIAVGQNSLLTYGQSTIQQMDELSQHLFMASWRDESTLDGAAYRAQVGDHAQDRSLCVPSDDTPEALTVQAPLVKTYMCELWNPWNVSYKRYDHMFCSTAHADNLVLRWQVPALQSCVRAQFSASGQHSALSTMHLAPIIPAASTTLGAWRLPTVAQCQLELKMKIVSYGVAKAERYSLTRLVQREGGLARNIVQGDRIAGVQFSEQGLVGYVGTDGAPVAADVATEVSNASLVSSVRASLASIVLPTSAVHACVRFKVDTEDAQRGTLTGGAINVAAALPLLPEHITRPDWTAFQPFIDYTFRENQKQFLEAVTFKDQRLRIDKEYYRNARTTLAGINNIGLIRYPFCEHPESEQGVGHVTFSNMNNPSLTVRLFARPVIAMGGARAVAASTVSLTSTGAVSVTGSIRLELADLDPWIRSMDGASVDDPISAVAGAHVNAMTTLTPRTMAQFTKQLDLMAIDRNRLHAHKGELLRWYK
jgi:hypothetical protein